MVGTVWPVHMAVTDTVTTSVGSAVAGVGHSVVTVGVSVYGTAGVDTTTTNGIPTVATTLLKRFVVTTCGSAVAAKLAKS